jgi:hypothetical protein
MILRAASHDALTYRSATLSHRVRPFLTHTGLIVLAAATVQSPRTVSQLRQMLPEKDLQHDDPKFRTTRPSFA